MGLRARFCIPPVGRRRGMSGVARDCGLSPYQYGDPPSPAGGLAGIAGGAAIRFPSVFRPVGTQRELAKPKPAVPIHLTVARNSLITVQVIRPYPRHPALKQAPTQKSDHSTWGCTELLSLHFLLSFFQTKPYVLHFAAH